VSGRATPPPTPHLVLASLAVVAPAAFLIRIAARYSAGAGENYDRHFFSVFPGLLADLRISLAPAAFAGVFGLLAGMALFAGLLNLRSAFSARRAGTPLLARDFAGPCRAAVRIGAAAVLFACVVLAFQQLRLGPSKNLWNAEPNQVGVTVAARLGVAVAIIAFAGAAVNRVLLALVCREGGKT
jgi:hypothetical protein